MVEVAFKQIDGWKMFPGDLSALNIFTNTMDNVLTWGFNLGNKDKGKDCEKSEDTKANRITCERLVAYCSKAADEIVVSLVRGGEFDTWALGCDDLIGGVWEDW